MTAMEWLPESDAAAREALAANPDLVFESVTTLPILAKDAALWTDFSAEWGGVLYLMEEMNRKRFEQGLIDEDAYEYARRTYRLGMIVLSELHDRLQVWRAGGDREAPYAWELHVLDCYFISGYLDDYGRAHPADKPVCRGYVEKLREQISGGDDAVLETAAVRLAAVAGAYIRDMHIYAGSTGA
jgi:hypothetical protein